MNNQIQIVLKSSTTEMSLNDHEAGIYIIPDLDGLTGLPEIRTTSGVNAGYDGGWTTAQNYDARSITLRGVIANSDVATVERLRKQLVTLLGQGKNEQLIFDIVTQAGNAYELMVRTIDCEMAMQRVLTQQEFMIQLRADDPLIYDNTAGSESVLVQVQRAIGGFEIDFELPLAISGGSGESVIENAGLEKVYPVIKMYGELHNPIFVNLTTNQQIQLNTNLAFADGDTETKSGNPISISNAVEAPLNAVSIYGNTSQTGTPTPSSPIQVQTVSGEQTIAINSTSYEVNLGKNLFDKDNVVIGKVWNGNNNAKRAYGYIEAIQGQQYTVSTQNTDTDLSLSVIETTTIGSGTSPIKQTTLNGNLTFTPQASTKYIAVQFGTTNATMSQTIVDGAKVQLELGSTATSYAAYFEPIELCKIGDYQDYIYKDGSDWKIHKACEKIVLSHEASTWSTHQTYTGGYLMTYGASSQFYNKLAIGTPSYQSYCSHLAFQRDAATWVGNNKCGFNSSGVFWCINEATPAKQDFLDWIGAVNPIVWFPLRTEAQTDTTITNSALIEQLEAVLAANTQTGVNSITLAPSLGETGSLTVAYYTSLPKRDEVIIDSRKRTVTLNGTDIYHLIADGSEFPILAPGENKLVLHSDITGDNGYAEVNYKQGYLSI